MFPYAGDGVDITLIRWMLSLSPAERLAVLQDFADFMWEAREKAAGKQVPSVLQTLDSHRVDFIVVGGVAAVLGGAPISTFDLDIVRSTAAPNLEHLRAALNDLDAYYRFQPERRRRPDATHLSSPGHQLLMTRFGPLDLRGAIGKGRSYPDLLPHTVRLEFPDQLRVHVLDLETVIAVKEEIAGDKDLAVLPVLRRTLEESRRAPLRRHSLTKPVHRPQSVRHHSGIARLGPGTRSTSIFAADFPERSRDRRFHWSDRYAGLDLGRGAIAWRGYGWPVPVPPPAL